MYIYSITIINHISNPNYIILLLFSFLPNKTALQCLFCLHEDALERERFRPVILIYPVFS